MVKETESDVRQSPIPGLNGQKSSAAVANAADARKSPIPTAWESVKDIIMHAREAVHVVEAPELNETESLDIFCDGSSPESSPEKKKRDMVVKSVRPSSSRRQTSSSSGSPSHSRSKRIERTRMLVENDIKSKSRNHLLNYGNSYSPTLTSAASTPTPKRGRRSTSPSHVQEGSIAKQDSAQNMTSLNALSGLNGAFQSMLDRMSKHDSSSEDLGEDVGLNGNTSSPESRTSQSSENEHETDYTETEHETDYTETEHETDYMETEHEESTIISHVSVFEVVTDSSPEREAAKKEKKHVKWSERIPSCYDTSFDDDVTESGMWSTGCRDDISLTSEILEELKDCSYFCRCLIDDIKPSNVMAMMAEATAKQ